MRRTDGALGAAAIYAANRSRDVADPRRLESTRLPWYASCLH